MKHPDRRISPRYLSLALSTLLLSVSCPLPAQTPARSWIPIPQEAKPYTRWWWLGSAVDSAGIDYNLTEFAKAGIGGVEITPIYGVQGNEANEIPFLSPRWMRMLSYVESRGRELGIETDMATGTGWPFGGPDVPESQAACKAVVQGDTIVVGRTGQRVKRAAPGGEGLVIDHFDHDAVASYLATFETAFATTRTPRPHTFFNDSYEVYGADWTPQLLTQFQRRWGYKLQDNFHDFLLPDSLRTDRSRRLLSDYRELMGDLLLTNFTQQWTDWAHRGGAVTRNQAHGSPANLIDIYAAVDIPECEGFGLSDFGIRGLRTDSGFTRPNFSDISMLKYASSAAHISGKPLTSSETFTWLTEHFRTSLSQCKPDLDLMFLAGINHVFFHGSCYSPKGEPWPGWRFYASVDMSPYTPWWNAMPKFSAYISRCQAFLQWGDPDNDFLVYLPYYDMIYEQPGRLPLFDIHSMAQRAPQFIDAIHHILSSGYDVDYISDRYLAQTRFADGCLTTTGRNRYAAVIIPDVRFMPRETLLRLLQLADAGATVVFVGRYPESEPGLARVTPQTSARFARLLEALKPKAPLAADYDEALRLCGGRLEPMRTQQRLSCIRRSHDGGTHYFISNLMPDDVADFISLGVPVASAEVCNPLTGQVLPAHIRDGRVFLRLASGESCILTTSSSPKASPPEGNDENHGDGEKREGSGKSGLEVWSLLASPAPAPVSEELLHWTLSFPEAAPVPIRKTYPMERPASWASLDDSVLNTTMATGCYTTTFQATPSGCHYVLDLGDVRETARVVLNGQTVDTLFSVPFHCEITPYLKRGRNLLEVFVTNLPANRIAQMDRDSVPWRHFKEINVVDFNYRHTTYAGWTPVPSGLNGSVRLLRFAPSSPIP